MHASLDTCFSSITKCNCCHLVLSCFVFNTLLNEPAFLKYLRLVTLHERSKKKWDPLKAKEDSWEKLEFFFLNTLAACLLASKKVCSLLDGKRYQGIGDCQLCESFEKIQDHGLCFHRREVREKVNVSRHCWVSLRKDVSWQNSELLVCCWLWLSQILHGLEVVSGLSGSVMVKLPWRFLHHQQSRTAQIGSTQKV